MSEHNTDRDPLGRRNLPTGIPGDEEALRGSLEKYVRGYMLPDGTTCQIDASNLLEAITVLGTAAREDALRTGYAFAISAYNQLARQISDALAGTPRSEEQITAADEVVIDDLLGLLQIDPVTGHIDAGELMIEIIGKPAHIQHEVFTQVVKRSNENSSRLRGRAISDEEVSQIINVGLNPATGQIDPDRLTAEMERLSLTDGDRATVLDAALRTSLEQTHATPEEDHHEPVLGEVNEVLTEAVQGHEPGEAEGSDNPDRHGLDHALALIATLLGLQNIKLTWVIKPGRFSLQLAVDDIHYEFWFDSAHRPRLTAKVDNTEVAVLTQEIGLDPATGLPSPNSMAALLGLYDLGTPQQHHRLVGQATKDVHDAIYGSDCAACATAQSTPHAFTRAQIPGIVAGVVTGYRVSGHLEVIAGGKDKPGSPEDNS